LIQTMKILCIDVGRGTQDILLYDSEKNLENCTQLIIPSRAVLAEKALKRRNVFATPMASKTFRDDPDVVREMGVKIVSEDEAMGLVKSGILQFEMMDVDIDGLSSAIELIGEFRGHP